MTLLLMKLSVIYSLKVSTASVDENGWKNVSEEGGSKANNISFNIADQTESIIEDVLELKTIRWYLLIFQFMDIFSM
jgi:hypothetical protein